MKLLSFLLLGLLYFFNIQAIAAGDLCFRHYNNKNGLSHNTVYCSIQDKRGFMWFGTDDGLNRFDGYTFKVYRHNSYSTESLPGNHILNLFEDSEGTIWICTENGTCYYDSSTDSFHPFKLLPQKETADYFTNITEDQFKNLWFIDHIRIVKYSLADKNYQVYPNENETYGTSATMGDEGYPVFSSSQQLFFYNRTTDKLAGIPALSEKERKAQANISVICSVPELGFLLGTDKSGLLLYNKNDKSTTTIIPEIQVRAITLFNNNLYWIGSESGVFTYNILTNTVTNLRKSLTNEYTIADNAVYSLTKDREGGMWVGSFFGGISYLPREYSKFHYFIGGKTHTQMLGNAVREISPDQYGNLWLGTEDNGINHYNLKTGTIINYSLNNPQRPLSATNIHGLLADGDKLWVGTYNKGIDVLDIPSGKIIKHYTRETTGNTLNSDFVLCFTKTKENEFLIGTSGGTILYNKKTDSFTHWKDIYALTRQIYEDSSGNIWVSTTNGIYCYQRDKDSIAHYTSDVNKSQSIGSNNTTSVFEDSSGRIWVTTSNGFSLYNEKTNLFNRITVEDGLPSNIIYRIQEDNDSKLWISTANGLVLFNPETYVMRTYSYTDGLHETQFNYSSSYKAPDGMIYMGTINGMLAFNPEQFKEDPFTPPVYLTRIITPVDKLRKHSLNPTPIEDTNILKLPYNASTFTLSYVALSYTFPDAIRYAYMLEGVDKEWIYMNQNKDVTFANLSPGKYAFKIRSTNSSGIWQDNERILNIIITPPFWATSWAFLIYFLLFGLLIVLFYNYKKTKLEEKHRINRDLFENKKEKELYDAKIQFFTFITHEIRTPLTLIKAPLEKILRSNDGTSSTKENLHIIERNTLRLLNLSNQLLDFRKTESLGFRLNFVKTDVTLWLETIIQPFIPVMEQEGKTFSADIPAEHLSVCIDQEAFSKIVTNLLTNAIKYSDKQISVRLITGEEGTFTLCVTNDGLLIPESDKENIFTPFFRLKETENKQGSGIGLSLARSLTEFHKGTLTYRKTDTGQNQFSLILPKEQEDYYQMTSGIETDEAIPSTPRVQEPGKPIILIVEDQPDMRQFIARELSETYFVLEADNGKTAVKLLNENTVNLIISDVMMPVMDGFELCNVVKNDVNFSHIPFLLLTAQHNLQSRLRGLNNGADAYMEKPFSIELLSAQIQNLLKSRELLNKSYQEKPLTPAATLAVSQVDTVFLTKLNSFIDENITDELLNVEFLAEKMGMSTSSLYRKVKGLSGLSPVDFIKIARLKKAVELMQKGESRINEIGFQVGFSSPAYFSTCFQKQYGKSPSEFLKGN